MTSHFYTYNEGYQTQHISDTHANSVWYSKFPTFHRNLGFIDAFR